MDLINYIVVSTEYKEYKKQKPYIYNNLLFVEPSLDHKEFHPGTKHKTYTTYFGI